MAVYLFPGHLLVKQLTNQTYISQVEVEYSVLLANHRGLKYADLKQHPEKVLLILDTAFTAYLKNPNSDQLWLNYIILKTIALNPELKPEISHEALSLMTVYLLELETVATNEIQRKELATDALALNQAGIALHFYQQMIAANSQRNLYFYTQVAKVAVWANECVSAADYYFIAQDLAKPLKDKRYLFYQGIKTLVGCGKSEVAMQAAVLHLDGLKRDPETFEFLTRLAMEADRPAKAQKYVIKLLLLERSLKDG